MTRPSLSPTTVAAIKRDLLTQTPAQVSLKHSVPYHVVQDIHLGRTYKGARKSLGPRGPAPSRSLDTNTVRSIKEDLRTMITSAVAEKHGVPYAVIYGIQTGATYRDD